jgi:hypothetical protein
MRRAQKSFAEKRLADDLVRDQESGDNEKDGLPAGKPRQNH